MHPQKPVQGENEAPCRAGWRQPGPLLLSSTRLHEGLHFMDFYLHCFKCSEIGLHFGKEREKGLGI